MYASFEGCSKPFNGTGGIVTKDIKSNLMSIPSVFGFIIMATTFQYAPGLVVWIFGYAVIWGLFWFLGEKLPVKYEARYMTSSIALMAMMGLMIMVSVIAYSRYEFVYLLDPILLLTLAIWIFLQPGMLSVGIASVYSLFCIVSGIFDADGNVSPISVLLYIAIFILLLINTAKLRKASKRDDRLWEEKVDA